MSNVYEVKWAAAIIIFLISALAGSLSLGPLQKRHWLGPLHSLANGIFLGVALFHFIPHSAHSINAPSLTMGYLYAILWTLVGLAVLFVIERWALTYSVSENTSLKAINTYVLAILLSIHAFMAGAALGIGQTETQIMIVFVAIMLHKACESFALIISLNDNKVNIQKSLIALLIFSCATPAGILFTTHLAGPAHNFFKNSLIGYFNALAAGTFLYIGGVHLTERLLKKLDKGEHSTLLLMMFLGLALMSLLAFWL